MVSTLRFHQLTKTKLGLSAAAEEDAPMRRSESRRSRGTNGWGEKNRRKDVNDKLAPHVREDIGGEIF